MSQPSHPQDPMASGIGAAPRSDPGPFHAGEEAVQRRLGVHDEIAPWARKVVRDFLPEPHRDFYAELPFLVAAARDARGRPWATLLVGPPGFARSPDPRRLRVAAAPVPGDALEGAISAGSDLGLLGIELATRRRNRVNGRVEADGPEGLALRVGQSFGNCPQYIRERAWRRVPAPDAPAPAVRSRTLTPEMQAWIASADTFFIASGHAGDPAAASTGMDASHRGGAPGFVELQGDDRLVFPDYAGNDHYNTLGNLVVDERVGLAFVDWEHGSLLQLTGRATIDWDSPAVARRPGARRLVVVELDEAVLLREALPLRWESAGDALRSLRVAQRRRESEDVVSFVFEARDGGALPGFAPGQHLPLELDVPGAPEALRRSYSLSGAPGDPRYRISVKREPRGVGSRFLHDAVEVGHVLSARPPAGDFVLAHGDRPVVLVSAGIGVTPLLAMLHDWVAREDARRVLFVHAARDGRHHPLRAEVDALLARARRASRHVFYSRPGPDDRPGRDFDARGRLDGDRLGALLPPETGTDADFYLCGPVSFMAALQDGLERRGVAAERIHSESFGPRG